MSIRQRTKTLVKRIGLTVLSAMLAFGIWNELRSDPLTVRAEHPAGFSVGVPDGFEVRRTDGRLVMIEAGLLRAPARLEVFADDTVFIGMPWWACGIPDFLAAGLRNCKVTELGSGSGGMLWRFDGSVQYGSQIVHVTAELQTEGPPVFDFARQVLMSVR